MRLDQAPSVVKVIIGILGIAAVPAISAALAYLNATYWPNFQI
jgi:hypothetical protein